MVENNANKMIKAGVEASNQFFALVGQISWFASIMDEQLNQSIQTALGIDMQKTKIMLPSADVRKKIDMLKKLLKSRHYQQNKLDEAIKAWDRAYQLFQRRNDIIHAAWIGVFMNPDGTAQGVILDFSAPPGNELLKTTTEHLVLLRSDFIEHLRKIFAVTDDINASLSASPSKL